MAKKYKLFAGGEWIEGSEELEVLNPYDGSLVGTVSLGSAAELTGAMDAAHAAFPVLKAWPSYKKAAAMERVVDGLKARKAEIAGIITREAGKPIRDSEREVERTITTFKVALEESKRLEGSLVPLDIMEGSEGRFGLIKRFPVGPVFGISPFNFPLNLVAHKVAPAMACSNPIILKPASKTPITALILAEIIDAAGWPAGGVNVVPCRAADAEALLDDERLKKLTFTGSPAVGWRLKAKSGLKRVTLELGGNAGAVVTEDSDIAEAARRCTTGAFAYAGQVCISVQRIYVHKSVFDEFKTLFIKECAALKLGDPLDPATDVGPMIDSKSIERTKEWVAEAIKDGAELLIGGEPEGNLFPPTVLTGTTRSMKVCTEELFAPVVTLETYDGFEEVIDTVNSGHYGLQAGIFTHDITRALYAFETLDVGGVIINDVPSYRSDNMPYGGVKMSGFGREGIKYAIEEMTELKVLVLKNPQRGV
jgi:glyceraldehyde-3-phosphate dehydrogenase (NADP+)